LVFGESSVTFCEETIDRVAQGPLLQKPEDSSPGEGDRELEPGRRPPQPPPRELTAPHAAADLQHLV